jgi:hypothetical protein
MTRGRKKDLTIPVSRSLVTQRAYRARKAAYIADLEDRVRKVDAENIRLRQELEAVRQQTLAAGGSGLSFSPQTVGHCVWFAFAVVGMRAHRSHACRRLRQHMI